VGGGGYSLGGLFADPLSPTDPIRVVDRMVELVDMKHGTRPFRNLVGVEFGTVAINDAVEGPEAAVLDGLGLTEFAPLELRRSSQ